MKEWLVDDCHDKEYHLVAVDGPARGTFLPIVEGTGDALWTAQPTFHASPSIRQRDMKLPRWIPTWFRPWIGYTLTVNTMRTPLQIWRWGHWHAVDAHAAVPLYIGQRIRFGAHTYQVRERPDFPTWALPLEKIHRRPGHLIRAVFPAVFLPMLFLRLPQLLGSVIPSPALSYVVTIGLYVFLTIACLWALGSTFLRVCRRRGQLMRSDAYALTHRLQSQSTAPRSRSDDDCAIWLGYPLQQRYARQILPTESSGIASRHNNDAHRYVHTPGFYGPHAVESARWWAAQVAAHCGGAVIRDDAGVWALSGSAQICINIIRCGPADPSSLAPTTPPLVSQEHHHQQSSVVQCHIYTARRKRDLPTSCDTLFSSGPTPAGQAWWESVVSQMEAPHCLPAEVSFHDLVSAQDCQSHDFSSSYLRVPIGMGSSGLAFIDLDRGGPHGIVVGTTGSGKSEALLTFVLSLCSRFSPEQVTCVLIDYKGGATFGALKDLPHCVEVCTDLNPSATQRALRGLEWQLVHREQQLRGTGFASFQRWEESYHGGFTSIAPPPRVVVVIDELAEVLRRHGDLVDHLNRIATQGRSLGFHLLIGSQQSHGVIPTSLKANADIRIALRTTNAADSQDVLGNHLACSLERIPGRAIIGQGSPIQFAYSRHPETVLQDINKRFGGQSTRLWAPALPHSLNDSDLPPVSTTDDLIIGVVDTIAHTGESLQQFLHWSGSSVAFISDDGQIRHCVSGARHLAHRLASTLQRPLHVIHGSHIRNADLDGHNYTSEWVRSSLSLSSFEQCWELLKQVPQHTPAVLLLEDVGSLLNECELRVGMRELMSLQGPLTQAIRSGSLILVGVFDRARHHLIDQCADHFISTHTQQGRLLLGCRGEDPLDDIPGRFYHRKSGVTRTVQLPTKGTITSMAGASYRSLNSWGIPNPETYTGEKQILTYPSLTPLAAFAPSSVTIYLNDRQELPPALAQHLERELPEHCAMHISHDPRELEQTRSAHELLIIPHPTPETLHRIHIAHYCTSSLFPHWQWDAHSGIVLVTNGLTPYRLVSKDVGPALNLKDAQP